MANNRPISSIVGGTRSELLYMPWEEYVGFPALNASVIVKAFVEDKVSMKHLLAAWNGDRKDSDAMQFGRMIHTLLGEPREFASRYAAWEGRRAGGTYTTFCDNAAAESKEVVKATGEHSMESALEAGPEYLKHPEIRKIVDKGVSEYTALWTAHGLQLKSRLDFLSESEGCLVDYKTTARLGMRSFGRTFFDLKYDVKLGLYRHAAEVVTGRHWSVVVFELESVSPYDAVPIPIPDAVLDTGLERGMGVIERVAKCIHNGEWPGVANNEWGELFVPYYYQAEETVEVAG